MAIKSNAKVALKYPEGMRTTDAEKFQAIASATNQMTRLTEDLLFLARTDKIPNRDWNAVNLTSILSNAVSQCGYQRVPRTKAEINIKYHVWENGAANTRTQLRFLIKTTFNRTIHAGLLKVLILIDGLFGATLKLAKFL
jgi:hypothetical protein